MINSPENPDFLQQIPLTADFKDRDHTESKPPLENYLDREAIVQLTNLFDELAKKYEDLKYDSENGLDFAQELKLRTEEIFSTRSNQLNECVTHAFSEIGQIAEDDLGFSLEKERYDGNFISPSETKFLEWFDQQKQREMLGDIVSWQQSVMKMAQWLGMLEGGQALVHQFSERWLEFAGKIIGRESAEQRLRGITGPLLFSKLCDHAGYDAFLPDVAWDRDDKIDLFIRPKDTSDIVFAVQLKERRNGEFNIHLEGEHGQSQLSPKALKEKENLIRSANKLDQSWSGHHGISVLPLFVSVEGLNDRGLDSDIETETADKLATKISQTLADFEIETVTLPRAA